MVYTYNREAQDKYSPSSREPFLTLDKDKLFAMDTKKDHQYRLRIMTYWSKAGLFALGAKVHFGVGIDKRSVVCPNMIGDGICPFCQVQAKIRGDKKYEMDSSEVRVKFRYYSNIVNMETLSKGVVVWSYGPQIFFPIKQIMDSGEYGDITHPVEGRDLLIKREIRMGRVVDAVYPAGNPTPIADENWLDQLVNLDTILPEPDIKLVEKLFKSHPWKVYEPTQRFVVPNTVEREQENLAEPAKPSPSIPVSQNQDVSPDSRMDRVKRLEEKLRSSHNLE